MSRGGGFRDRGPGAPRTVSHAILCVGGRAVRVPPWVYHCPGRRRDALFELVDATSCGGAADSLRPSAWCSSVMGLHHFPVDILVRRHDQFEQSREAWWTVTFDPVHEGRLLYAAA